MLTITAGGTRGGKHVTALKIIIGSTRATRAADLVWPWVEAQVRAHGSFEPEILDLRDWPLPFFAESPQTVGDPADPTYSAPIVKRWNAKIAEGDAYLIITPEYNHSLPAVLKNAIDCVYRSYALRNKPVAFVSYSVGIAGGVRAIEHLVDIAFEAELVPMRNSVLLPQVSKAFEGGLPVSPVTASSLGILLDDLAWWADVLGKARSEGELLPAPSRLFRAGGARPHSPA
jgi:NAD(P)H-dependent FMN reductase